jgi:hypothetical protein
MESRRCDVLPNEHTMMAATRSSKAISARLENALVRKPALRI